ncbi:MAG TPA: hypothetical protein VHE60_07355 [Pyrinomonadaceae bacterium]|nr:hypothetical protein [Pyrinomonadaceae bacterium]
MNWRNQTYDGIPRGLTFGKRVGLTGGIEITDQQRARQKTSQRQNC